MNVLLRCSEGHPFTPQVAGNDWLDSLGDGEHANWAKLEHEAMEPIADLPCSEAEFKELGNAFVQGNALSSVPKPMVGGGN